MPSATSRPVLFFTAFEPSGDDHAATVIRTLRRRHPSLPIHAWGGPKMAEAGAKIIRNTGNDAVIGLPGLRKINDHLSYNRKIGRWLSRHRVTVHIPVDSPAANFPICVMTKDAGAKVVHLVAPQMWAWGSWRVRKLRRLTDHVLCLLPFEEQWFKDRGVPATYIGHPLFDEPLKGVDDPRAMDNFPAGQPRIALMPGSRPAEIAANFPLLLGAFRELRARRPGLVGVVAATTEQVAERLRAMAEESGGWPEGLGMELNAVDRATRWCDLALAVSGTVTLQIARQARPTIVVYRMNRLGVYNIIGRWVISTEHFALPNVIAGKRIIPEFVPYFGGPQRLISEAERLLDDAAAREAQRRELSDLVDMFKGRSAAENAADMIEAHAGLRDQTLPGEPSITIANTQSSIAG